MLTLEITQTNDWRPVYIPGSVRDMRPTMRLHGGSVQVTWSHEPREAKTGKE